MPAGERYYGLGERTGLLDKRGHRYTCWTTDRFEDHGPRTDSMYAPVPFVFALDVEGRAWGLYADTTFRTTFDFSDIHAGVWSMAVDAPWIDWYCFTGPQCATVLDRFTTLTGRAHLPPRWALGYHQTRWGYETEDDISRVARELRSRRLPSDVIGFDIDSMDAHRVFTWDRSAFPDPSRLTKELAADGFKVTAIVDPGVKHDPGSGYATYDAGVAIDAFLREPGSDGLLLRDVWPGLCAFPDFLDSRVRAWWGDEHRALTDAGIQGFVEDMNEPAMRDRDIEDPDAQRVDPPSETVHGAGDERVAHREGHNVYGLLQVRAAAEAARRLRPEERTLVLTRAGYAGVQRWAGLWTGDNGSSWEHLEMSLPQLCSLGLSGIPFVGADIGGFFGSCTPELMVRWMQLGACYPLARNNCAREFAPQEPWAYGEDVEDACRSALEWRYRHLPYLYTQLRAASETGVPVLRPLFFLAPEDDRCRVVADEALFGPDLLIAPVVRPGKTFREVYLPRGQWFDTNTDETFTGPVTILADAPLRGPMPVYARAGSVIPLAPVLQWSDQAALDPLHLHVYPDGRGDARCALYEDDGISFAYERGEWTVSEFRAATSAGGQCRIQTTVQGDGVAPLRRMDVTVHATPGPPR